MRFRIVFVNGFEARTKAFTPKRQRVKSEPVLRTFVFRSGKERLCFLGSWGERSFVLEKVWTPSFRKTVE